ncbi:MAG: RdgB/HAM1 family non-canonical purine NTP pyrophosphatase [Candidatus Bipolaricaulota bacterium]|nr:MAG: RdgB/HAM1 family non-canonical purine NTP pyrophosphatase [Candidatus Bipolaricaulota bacterium]
MPLRRDARSTTGPFRVILLLGTGNPGKIRELRAILEPIPGLQLATRDDTPFPDIPEVGSTFAENAILKARGIASATGVAVLAEDSGLCVRALRGAPGVRSARYAGSPTDHRANTERLLRELTGVTDRAARFVSVAVLRFEDGREVLRAGVLAGRIARRPTGSGGFGYDPVFVPDGFTQTLAELPPETKNELSHRVRAVNPLRGVLRQELDARASR